MKEEKKPDVAKLLGITDDLMFQNVMKDPVNCRMFLHEVFPDLEMQVHRKKTWINEHATTCIR